MKTPMYKWSTGDEILEAKARSEHRIASMIKDYKALMNMKNRTSDHCFAAFLICCQIEDILNSTF